MKIMLRLLAVAASLSFAHAALAQAPAGSTGQCKDGTYSSAASKSGACRGHQGVKEWYAAAPAAKAAPAAAAATAPAAATAKSAPAAAAATVKSAPAVAASGMPPAGSTGACKDGTYTSAASKSGACRGHQGVKEWYAAASSSKTAPAPAAVVPPAPVAAKAAAAAPAPAAPSTPTPAASASGKMSPQERAAATPQAAGGGPGLVWVNTSSKVYHCSGTTFYGKTKEGKYMSEADAKAMGAHADHNHPCTK